MRQLRMELHAKCRRAVLKRLMLEGVAGGEELRPGGEPEALAVPLVDVARPVEQYGAFLGGAQRVVADLDETPGMKLHRRAERAGENLRAQANAEERLLLGERHRAPLDLAADVVVGIVGDHRPAEPDDAGVMFQRVGQRLAQRRPALVERESAPQQRLADPAGGRMLLMKNDEDLFVHGSACVADNRIRFRAPCDDLLAAWRPWRAASGVA